MPSDQRLLAALRRLSVRCTVQVGSNGPAIVFRHAARDAIALVDTGASLCAISSQMIPPGCLPVAFHTGAVNVAGPLEEIAVYRCRLAFDGYPTTVELDCLGHNAGGDGCDLVLGTPFLSMGRLIYDVVHGESHFSIHTR